MAEDSGKIEAISSLGPKSMTPDELLKLINQAAEEGWTELDLSGKGLTDLPPEIGKLTQLETLILGKWETEKKGPEGMKGHELDGDQWVPLVSGNLLTTLPLELSRLVNLRKLDLSGNALNDFSSVSELKSLETVTAIHSELTEIPEAIAQLTNLTKLFLSSNQITEIPEAIVQLTNLTTLFLSHNQITEIPEAIAQLTNLTTLDLSNNQITEIPEAIAQLTNLTTLDLSSNQITEISGAITQLTNLTTLDLFDNQITEIPEVIAQLANLTMLSLSNNQITEIPEAIAQLTNLTKLNFNSNQTTVIPEAIGQLSSLTEIDFSSNQITVIPEAIGQLSSLTELYLISNQITVIPEAIGQLSNLTVLYLWNNQITVIPEAIGQLSSLTVLSLSGNQITVIPEVIGQLSSLTKLVLSGNQITVIPEAIGQLSSLTVLDLGSNQITVIPETIRQLSSLTELYLGGNLISEIPSYLEKLSDLQSLSLQSNPLPIPVETLAYSKQTRQRVLYPPEKLFNYLRELRSGDKRQLNEAKLLLIGQGSVGKTSLINRLINDRYNPNEPQTDGLTVTTWPLEVNAKPIRLNVWDFGGQEIYHATHQFFLTKRSLYILTCNCRTSEDENRIEYWLKLIQSFGGKSPVIIVGNKSDEQPLDINRKALKDKYPNIKAILETSCENGKGIDNLRDTITREVAQLNDVYNLLPLTWFKVKEQLESMNDDFISYGKYACLCEAQKVTNEESQEQLIDLLHKLGLVLNFRKHPLLQNTNVLNPNWVTEGIYAILSDDALKTDGKGILTEEDLTRILNAERYPANRHDFLTELMHEFELGFLLPNSQPKKFLIPGLLPKDQPEDTDLEGKTLEFQYHYRILPDSIISRFIVNRHDRIHDQTYWRSGVMLSYKESGEIYNIARVKADPEDKKIFMTISGRESTRRLFLGIIRDTFNNLHNSFENLEVTEWVPVPEHPEHPPLDYQELLGLERMGEQTHAIGKLGIRVNIRQLLDGYEPLESRQRRRRAESGKEGDLDEDFLRGRGINIKIENKLSQGDHQPMTDITNNNQGANIANFANEVKDNARQQANQHIHPAAQQDLAAAARDIKTLLDELSEEYNPNSSKGQTKIKEGALTSIRQNPQLKQRTLKALKSAGEEALEQAIQHPVAKVVVEGVKGFIDG